MGERQRRGGYGEQETEKTALCVLREKNIRFFFFDGLRKLCKSFECNVNQTFAPHLSTVVTIIEMENLSLNFVFRDFSHKQIGSQERHIIVEVHTAHTL